MDSLAWVRARFIRKNPLFCKMDLSQINYTWQEKKKGLVLPKKMTSGLAYLCGVIAGDGSINYRDKNKEYSVECAGNSKDEIEFYEKVVNPLFKNLFGFSPKLNYYSLGSTYGFRIYSKSLFYYFVNVIGLPYGKKYSKLKIPACIINNNVFLINFIRGLMDTDGCITFKKKNKYPTLVLASASYIFVKEISLILKGWDFYFYEVYNYKVYDARFKNGFSIINRIEINGKNNLKKWMKIIGFSNPKHIRKINISSEGWI